MRDRQIAGVCSGLAEHFALDPTLVRVVYLLATVGTAFAGCLAYVVLWLVIPERDH